jgi:hypothetical protein
MLYLLYIEVPTCLITIGRVLDESSSALLAAPVCADELKETFA